MNSEETIFAQALTKGSAAEQALFLEEACAGNLALRHELEMLLIAHHQAAGILEAQPADLVAAGRKDSAEPLEAPGAMVGPYRLREQIGGGGMGVVYMAEQLRPVRRTVAVKIIKPGMDSGQIIARFEAERQALTMMDHPNIAKVLDAGTTDAGRPYFVMELVKGIPITDYCDRARLTTRQRLEVFIDVCNAVQHAHHKGVIHRDLKPSNVLVALHDEKPVPKVIDFGIAKAAGQMLTERTLFTHSSQMLGTPLYMSPEQADFSPMDVDTRSDVYSLGVLLYELLTGTTPFDKQRLREATYDEMRRIIREEEPPKPSTRLSTQGEQLATISHDRNTDAKKLEQAIRGDLDSIVMKALEKDRARRYETANGLARDVGRYLQDEPVLACPPSKWYRCRKFARRHKGALVTTMIAILAVLTTVAGLATSTILISRQQRVTAGALAAETRTKGDLQQTLLRYRITLAYRELSADNLGRALELLADCPAELRDWEWYYLMRLCRVEPVILRDKCEIMAVAFDSDGARIAAGCGDNTVKIWDVASRKVIQTVPCHDVFSVAFSPDRRHVASAGADQKVRLWELATGREVFSRPGHVGDYAGTACAIAFSPDGQQLVAGDEEGFANVWSVADGHKILRLPEKHENTAVCIAFSADGATLATGSWEGVLRIWDARAGTLLRKIAGHTHRLSAIVFSPGGRTVATASFDRTMKVWDVSSGQLLQTMRGHTGVISGLAFSANGRRLFSSGGEDKTIKVWDPQTGEEVLNLRGNTLFCHGLTISPDGARLASAGKDGTIRIWDATRPTGTESPGFISREHGHEVWSVEFSADGQYLASASWGERTVRIWDVKDVTLRHTFPLPPDIMNLFHLSFSPDSKHIATAAASPKREAFVCVYETATGLPVFNAVREGRSVPFFVTFDPTGKLLVREGPGHTVQVRDAGTGNIVGVIGRHALQIWGMAFSPDGLRLATASNDGTVSVWAWNPAHLGPEQQPQLTLPARVDGYGNRVAFSADGRYLATGGELASVKIWDAATGDLRHTLPGHTLDVFAVAFSRDGRWLATAGEDTTVRIWDTATWTLRRTLRGHTGLVMSLAFSPDSRLLASGSRDHTMKVWETADWDAGH